MLYKLPCKSSLMHDMLKLDFCSIWKENLLNSCTGAARLPSGAHSVHLYGCWSQPLACGSGHSPIVPNKTLNSMPVAACQRCQPPGGGVGRAAHQSITAARLPRVCCFFWVFFIFLVWLLWSQPRPVFHVYTGGSLSFWFTVHLSGIKYGSHTCQTF